ncbi:hypothetical protein Rsub_08121 [Raphidocelis subcapitata]|uniref:C3H1-type domain-containing protein n=1 Tax=Raphidocelis subcapitata TaxID=307507 RepID=A0A2V0P4T5_9CHLO|nr:hypothetical protein Rsub_08121 [Raphidocelis subcapitata]|eukprot:GBF94878.1 hypothetical protein Rsub_08121 [Raphidocelis subcapitata]
MPPGLASAGAGLAASPPRGAEAAGLVDAPPTDGSPDAVGETKPSDAPVYRTDEFRINCYKVLACSRRTAHDWKTCPFVHPGEHGRRRPLAVFHYEAVMCPAVRRGEPCPAGDACDKAHNVFEMWLHPDRYRTQICIQGTACTRKVCFFAHTPAELRRPPVRQSSAGRNGVLSGRRGSDGPSPTQSPAGTGAGIWCLPVGGAWADLTGALPGPAGGLPLGMGVAPQSAGALTPATTAAPPAILGVPGSPAMGPVGVGLQAPSAAAKDGPATHAMLVEMQRQQHAANVLHTLLLEAEAASAASAHADAVARDAASRAAAFATGLRISLPPAPPATAPPLATGSGGATSGGPSAAAANGGHALRSARSAPLGALLDDAALDAWSELQLPAPLEGGFASAAATPASAFCDDSFAGFDANATWPPPTFQLPMAGVAAVSSGLAFAARPAAGYRG